MADVDDDRATASRSGPVAARRSGQHRLQPLRDIRRQYHLVAVKLREHSAGAEARHRPATLRARHNATLLKGEQRADSLEEPADDPAGAKQAVGPQPFGNAAPGGHLAGADESPREILIAAEL